MIYFAKNFHNKACNFIDACATLIESDRIIVNDLVKNLINGGLWDLGYLINPVIGGIAGTHKFNLKDPRDLDDAYRLAFYGTITHSANGMQGNGIDGYYDTFLIDNVTLAQDSMSLGIYTRNNIGLNSAYDIVSNQTTSWRAGILSRNGANNFVSRCHDSTANNIANLDSTGWFCISRTDSAGYRKYKNSTETIVTMASASRNATSYQGMKWSTVYNTREQAFIWIGAGLSSSQALLLYSIIQAYQTAKGRQV